MLDTIDRLRIYIPTIISNVDMSRYSQSIADAESWIVTTLLGAELMDQIRKLDPNRQIYIITERLMAYKAYALAIPKLDLVESPNGFAVVNDDKLLPASRERVTALVASMDRSATQTAGEMIEWFERSAEYRELWLASAAGIAMSGSLIASLSMFRYYGTFAGDYFEYMAAQPTIRAMIMRYIEPRISRELTREIITQVQDNALSDTNLAIIDDLRYALTSYYNDRLETAELALSKVRNTIENNADNYPAFRNSQLYISIVAAREKKAVKKTSIYIM